MSPPCPAKVYLALSIVLMPPGRISRGPFFLMSHILATEKWRRRIARRWWLWYIMIYYDILWYIMIYYDIFWYILIVYYCDDDNLILIVIMVILRTWRPIHRTEAFGGWSPEVFLRKSWHRPWGHVVATVIAERKQTPSHDTEECWVMLSPI